MCFAMTFVKFLIFLFFIVVRSCGHDPPAASIAVARVFGRWAFAHLVLETQDGRTAFEPILLGLRKERNLIYRCNRRIKGETL